MQLHDALTSCAILGGAHIPLAIHCDVIWTCDAKANACTASTGCAQEANAAKALHIARKSTTTRHTSEDVAAVGMELAENHATHTCPFCVANAEESDCSVPHSC